MNGWLTATTTLGVATAGVGVALYGTLVPGQCLWGRVICRGSRGVALTFDDGPTPGGTDRILDALARLRVPATFFVIGQSVAGHPDLVQRMDAEGHTVGNHSYDHDHFGLFRGLGYWRGQLERTDECIAKSIGKKPAFFRPPMGFMTWPIHRAARRSGHAVIAWSRRGRDGVSATSQGILQRLSGSRTGDIHLLHDGIDPHIRRPVDRSATVAALEPLVASIRAGGMEILPLGDLLGLRPYAG